MNDISVLGLLLCHNPFLLADPTTAANYTQITISVKFA